MVPERSSIPAPTLPEMTLPDPAAAKPIPVPEAADQVDAALPVSNGESAGGIRADQIAEEIVAAGGAAAGIDQDSVAGIARDHIG